jgi:predicted aspartyl protease
MGSAPKPTRGLDKPVAQKPVAEFKIEREPELILLPVRFNEKEYHFIFDTGSSCTTFDVSLKDRLGLPKGTIEVKTAGSSMKVEVFDAPEAFLGAINIRECREVSCMDFRMLSLVSGSKISGIIGMNLLKEYVVQIDFDNGKISFFQPAHRQTPNWGKALPIDYELLGCPRITGGIVDGISVDFLIDSGANGTGDLESKIFSDILKGNGVKKTSKTFAQTASDTQQQREIRTGNLSLGPFRYQELIFGEANKSRLALSFLSRHMVTFDFPGHKIYLKKGKQFRKTDETNMSGLHIIRVTDKIVVYAVDENSPAQKAGIKEQDVILKVDGKDTNVYDICDIRRILRSGDKRCIMMTTKRGDNVREISFFLKKKI